MEPMTQRAILRVDYDRIPAGTLMYVSALALKCRIVDHHRRDICFPAASVERPELVIPVPRKIMLDRRRFLKRQPVRKYWTITRPDWTKPEALFLQDPKTITFGPCPHRFESFGEVVYYMNRYKLISRHYLVQESSRYPWIATVFSHRRKSFRNQ